VVSNLEVLFVDGEKVEQSLGRCLYAAWEVRSYVMRMTAVSMNGVQERCMNGIVPSWSST
jgi:hypothetical protein